jgi:hypothetical protein
VSSTSLLRLTVLEDFKCAVRGSEVKSQLQGLVRVQSSADGGDAVASIALSLECPAKEIVCNPVLQHERDAAGRIVFSGPALALALSAGLAAEPAPAPTVLLKYKQDGFALPLCVKVQAGVKSATTGFVVLQANVALNMATFGSKKPALVELKLSLKGLSRFGIVDVRGKHGPGLAFSWDADKCVALWTGASGGGGGGEDGGNEAALQSVLARVEVQEQVDEAAVGAVRVPSIATVTFPNHLASATALSAAGSIVSSAARLEYTFL